MREALCAKFGGSRLGEAVGGAPGELRAVRGGNWEERSAWGGGSGR